MAVGAMDRLLVIRLGAMGDVIRTLPAVAALRARYPGAHLTWLVEPASAGVVDVAGIADETLVFPRSELVEAIRVADALALGRCLGDFLRLLRQRRFDLVLDFHGLFKSGLLSRLSGAPVRVAFAAPGSREFAWLFANRRIEMKAPEQSRFDRNRALVAALAPDADFEVPWSLRPSDLAVARLAARLRATGREDSRDFALLHPGSSAGAQYKRYPAADWVEVARRLSEGGLPVWVAAGPNRHERNLAEQVVKQGGAGVVLAPETRSFDDLLALLARAGVFLAADSGPLHAASLSRIPVVQLMGPTHPGQNEPWRETPSRRLHVPPDCSPCRRGCADPVCMRAITPTAVADAAFELLRETTHAALEMPD